MTTPANGFVFEVRYGVIVDTVALSALGAVVPVAFLDDRVHQAHFLGFFDGLLRRGERPEGEVLTLPILVAAAPERFLLRFSDVVEFLEKYRNIAAGGAGEGAWSRKRPVSKIDTWSARSIAR